MKLNRLTSFLFLFPMCVFAASVADVDTKRATRASREFEKSSQEKRELMFNEFWLLSFVKPLEQQDFLTRFGQDGLGLTALYVCDSVGGITAFYGDQTITPSEQINKVRFETRAKFNADVVRGFPVADPSQSSPSAEKKVIRENFSICGAEVRATRTQMVGLRSRMSSALKAVEITNTNYRRFPIYSR